MIRNARTLAPLALAVAFAGCGSTETQEDPKTAAITRPAEDPPRQAEQEPPLGRAKPKVPPSSAAMDMRSGSLLHDETPK